MSSEEIKTFRKKLKRARDNGKLQEISDACCNLAAYLSDEEEHEEALKLYKESLTCCEKLGNKVGAALAHRMIAEECTNLGYFEEALEHVSIFLKYAQDEADLVEEQRGLVLKGHVFFTQAEYLTISKPQETKTIDELLEQSMQAYRKSFAICNSELLDVSEREKVQMKARLLQNKSLVLSRQNKLDYALAHLVRAIKMCSKEKLNDTEHICYLTLAEVYLKKEEPQKALKVYEKALELSHSTQKKIDTLMGTAKAYITMENYQQAKATLKKTYKLRADEETKKLLKNVVSILRLENNLCSTPDSELKLRKDLYKKLGDTYMSLKSYKNSIKAYLNMLGCVQKAGENKNSINECYSLLSKAYSKDKQYDKALFYSNQEIEGLSKWSPEKAYKIYLRIAKLHELNKSEFDEINVAYSEAKNRAKQCKNYKVQRRCLKRLISVGESLNKQDLVSECQKELKELANDESNSCSSCDSGNDSESDVSNDSDNNSEQSSDEDLKGLLSDSDVENEEYDRPKERCKRTKFTIKRNEKGETDLHVAAIKGNYKKVQQLINQGHPVNVRDTAGWTPLHEACNHGYVDIVNILLDYGANINDKGGPSCDGTTPLHDAATNGQLLVIEALIKRGASTLVLNDAGETPLQCLLAWKRNTALDADEDEMIQSIIKTLKSPLDSDDIKRHIKPNKRFSENKSIDIKPVKDIDLDNKFKSNTSVVSDFKKTIQLLRRDIQPNRRNSSGRSSINSDEEDFCGFKSKNKSACDEYREAIEELRFKPKKKKEASTKAKPIPALIRADKYVDNCIMENDDEESDIEEVQKKTDVKRDSDSEMYSRPRKKHKSSPTTKPRKPSLEDEFKSKSWLKSIPVEFLEDSFELPENEDIFKSPPSDKIESENTIITVRLFNDKVDIPVKASEIDKLNIAWLIEEVNKTGKLQAPDCYIHVRSKGGALENSDCLSKITDKEVEFVVTKWKAIPLSERYEKVCTIASHPDMSSSTTKLTINPHVVDKLKEFPRTRTLSLSSLKLSSYSLIPVCKSIKYETFIQSLDLSDNYFGDSGVELIVKTLQTCIIAELNVSRCHITSTGVVHFSEALKGMNELSKNGLEVLDLSGNPITDDAIEAINQMIELLPSLRSLNISGCDLDSQVVVKNSPYLVLVQGNAQNVS